ncbi:MAG: hypothetical protein IPJ77_21925 [Planctomycetes bacterium]|nr:hypothetical protein [Planctomycetota bacterium]
MARPTQAHSEIQTLVESFATELTQLVRRTTLQQLRAALGDDAAANPARSVRVVRMGKTARAPKFGGKRSTEQVEQFGATVYAYIQQNPGQRGEQIAKALKTDVKTMRLPVQRLIADKKVKTKGQRRGTTYFPA